MVGQTQIPDGNNIIGNCSTEAKSPERSGSKHHPRHNCRCADDVKLSNPEDQTR